jgi:hypothetical protein
VKLSRGNGGQSHESRDHRAASSLLLGKSWRPWIRAALRLYQYM